jgi:holliday junction resolvase YEN1
MGVTGLWSIIGDGTVTSLAALSSQFLKTHGRPIRIAVDEVAWRFKNLNHYQVAAIQAKVEAAHPVEKAIFHRIVGLLKLNIHLIFVFDGPRRPWKRGRAGGNKINYERIEVLKKLLDALRVPAHRAPGEAEAECARLQREGIVDAVWSEDGDSLMFGCGLLFKNHLEKGGAKSKTHVRVYREQEILEKHGLDREGMILFAMLSGGDYDVDGIKGCGPANARRAAAAGLGHSLCRITSAHEAQQWRLELIHFFRGKVKVPHDFPNLKTLNKYRDPVVCTAEQMQNLRGLRYGWDNRPIDEPKLRSFLRLHFNIWTKGYIKHILPVLLVKYLWSTQAGQESRHSLISVELKKIRGKKKDDAEAPLERKITFLPQPVTKLDLSRQPSREEEEDWSQLATKSEGTFNPFARVECEILECVLQRGVPSVLVGAAAAEQATQSAPPKKRQKKTRDQNGQAEATAIPKLQKSSRKSTNQLGPSDLEAATASKQTSRKRKSGEAQDTSSGSKRKKTAPKSAKTAASNPSPPKAATTSQTTVIVLDDSDSEVEIVPTSKTPAFVPQPRVEIVPTSKTPTPSVQPPLAKVPLSDLKPNTVREQVRQSWAQRLKHPEFSSPARVSSTALIETTTKVSTEIDIVDLT